MSARIVMIRDDGPTVVRRSVVAADGSRSSRERKVVHSIRHGTPHHTMAEKVDEGPAPLPKALNRFYMTRKRSQTPEFLNRLDDKWHHHGDNITMRIGYRGFPDPEVHWFKDQELIANTMHTMITAGEGNTELVILDAQKSDTGFYTCRVENSLGVRETSCQIYIGDTGHLDSSLSGRAAATSSYRSYRSLVYTPRWGRYGIGL